MGCGLLKLYILLCLVAFPSVFHDVLRDHSGDNENSRLERAAAKQKKGSMESRVRFDEMEPFLCLFALIFFFGVYVFLVFTCLQVSFAQFWFVIDEDQPLQSPSWSSQLVEDCCPERRQPLSVNMAPMGFPRVAVFYLLTAPWRASLFPWLCSLVALIDFAPSKILG
jgi:hypothetical protein